MPRLKLLRIPEHDTLEFEVGLPVSDFMNYNPDEDTHQDCRDEAFEYAQYHAEIDAHNIAWAEIECLIGRNDMHLLAVAPSFLEFDSANISHACAHWKIVVTGPGWMVGNLRQALANAYL